MFNRATTFLVVLAICAFGASSLHAQSLSPDQEAKLDARLEGIIQKANQGKLEAAIDRFSEQIESARERRSAEASREDLEGQRSEVDQDERRRQQTERIEHPPLTPENVTPTARENGSLWYDAIVYADNASSLDERGVQVKSTFDGFATVRATPEGLEALSARGTVDQIRSPKRYRTQDLPSGQTGAQVLHDGIGGTEYTGEGVLACVIDSGIDWDHPDFTDEQGRSRVRYIWDQLEDTRATDPPLDFTYGDGYGPEDIRNGNVEHVDDVRGSGHGTHVSGVLASSGNAHEESQGSEKYKGMAPGANLVVVSTDLFSTSILDGLSYCRQIAEAEGKPMVINMSFGSPLAPHDGSSPLARAVEELTDGGDASGLVAVTSAGNNAFAASGAGGPAHVGPVTAGTTDAAEINLDVTEASVGFSDAAFIAELYAYEKGQDYSFSVYTPEDDTLTLDIPAGASVDTSAVFDSSGDVRISSAQNPQANNRNIRVAAKAVFRGEPLARGEWTFQLRNNGDTNAPVHGWTVDPGLLFAFGQLPAGTQFLEADVQSTLTSPATSPGAIAVGSYVNRMRYSDAGGVGTIASAPGAPIPVQGTLSGFSSRGPTIDNREKPELTAPGQRVISALSQDITPIYPVDSLHQGLDGTSFAAPAVAGAVALLLQEDPTLSTSEAATLLSETARVDEAVEDRGGAWNTGFGNGKLNALGAVTRLRQGGQGAPPLEVLSYNDEPINFETERVDSLGGDNGADSLALRFTPTVDGFMAGAYVSVAGNSGFFLEPDGTVGYTDTSNTLSEPLRVQVYTDDEGEPGTAVGNPIEVPPSKLASFQSNFIDFHGAAASVSAETDYHLVLTTSEGETGSLLVMSEEIGTDAGRSMKQEGSSWTATGTDLVMRAQVSADVFPPAAVAGLSVPTAEPENVELSWDGVDEAAEYYVYRDTEPLPKRIAGLDPLAMVEGGTTYTDDGATAGQTYYYRVAAVNEDGNRSEASSEVTAFLYPSSVTADANRTFGDGPPGASGASYRLVALPGDTSLALQETISGQAGLDWQAYAETSSGLVSFDGTDTFNLEAGTGFWLSSASAWTSSAEHSTVSLEGDSAATVSLSDGWNIVSNPMGKDVPFAAIQAAHADTLQPMMAWDGSWNMVDTMQSASSGVAYYFNNTAGLDELSIPYPGSPGYDDGSTAAPKAKDASLLALSARSATTGGPASTVKVGLDARASNGLDARDYLAPTGQFENVSLRLDAPENSRSLLVERRAPIGNGTTRGRTFALELDSDVSGPVQISARNLSAVEGYEVALLQPGAGKTHDLRHNEQVTVTPDGETTLKLAVGSKAYVEGRSENVVPDKVTLSSYPNPFRQQATVEYALPKAQEVRLVLYDVLGREVAVLENGRKDAGHHTVRLNADQLASGVYFGRLKAGNKQLTQKITVVR